VIGKLRGRSLAELQDRGTHALRTIADRRGWLVPALPAGEVPVPDTPFAAAAHATPALPDGVRDALLAQADTIVAGRLPVLGYGALDYGAPPDWQRDPVSGRRAPLVHWSAVPYLDVDAVGDHKVTWEAGRHQWLLRLAQAWRLTRDVRYADRAASLLGHWIDANPPKRGMHWTSALELAFRTLAWTYAWPMLADAPPFDDALRRRVATSLLVQVDHLEWNLSTWFSPNTHLTGEALALMVTGIAWPTLPGAARRRDAGWRILRAQAPVQHRADGSYFEQTTWYQAYTVDFYLQAFHWARHAGLAIPNDVHARVHAAARALRAFARPDGTIPLLGDDDGGHTLPLVVADPADVTDTLARAALVFDDPTLTVPGGIGRWALPWLEGDEAVARLATLERDPRSDAARDGAVLRDGGWVVLRERGATPDRDHHLVLDAGPHGALSCGHAHADALAVTLAVHGVPIVVDPGTGAYVGALRNRYRATRAHATVTVDGLDSSEQGTAFRWRTATDARLLGAALTARGAWADAYHDGYARLADPVRHRRTIGRPIRRYWIMLDTLTCAAPHAIDLVLPCAPGTDVSLDAAGRRAALARAGVTLHVAADPSCTLAVEPRTVSPAYGAEVAAPALVAHADITGDTTLCTVLGSDAESGPLALARTGVREWQVTHRTGTDTIVAPLGRAVTVRDVTFDGAWAALLDGGATLVAAGRGTLAAGPRRMTLGDDGMVVLRRDGDRWTDDGER
jgi:hypothetical protein